METDCLKKKKVIILMLNLFFGMLHLMFRRWKIGKKREKKASIIIPFGLFFPNHVRAKIIHQRCIIISTCSQSPSFNSYAITPLSHAFLFWFWVVFIVQKKIKESFFIISLMSELELVKFSLQIIVLQNWRSR